MGMRIPNCGLMIAATVVRTVAGTMRPFQSSRTARRRTTVPTESTWPQTALSNQVTGLNRTRPAPRSAARRPPPRSRTIHHTTKAIAPSAMIGGSLIRSPAPPMKLPTIPTSHRT